MTTNISCYTSSRIMRNTFSCIIRIFIFHYARRYIMENKYSYYTSSYIIINKYSHYTSSRIMRNTFSCITKLFVIIIYILV